MDDVREDPGVGLSIEANGGGEIVEAKLRNGSELIDEALDEGIDQLSILPVETLELRAVITFCEGSFLQFISITNYGEDA